MNPCWSIFKQGSTIHIGAWGDALHQHLTFDLLFAKVQKRISHEILCCLLREVQSGGTKEAGERSPVICV